MVTVKTRGKGRGGIGKGTKKGRAGLCGIVGRRRKRGRETGSGEGDRGMNERIRVQKR